MLLSLAAGATADIWDRRLVMLIAQGLMLIIAVALTVIAYMGMITPWMLLSLTFLLGLRTALYAPAWQSSVGEQVPRADLASAVALNSLAFNIATHGGSGHRSIIVAKAGPPARVPGQLPVVRHADHCVGAVAPARGRRRFCAGKTCSWPWAPGSATRACRPTSAVF